MALVALLAGLVACSPAPPGIDDGPVPIAGRTTSVTPSEAPPPKGDRARCERPCRARPRVVGRFGLQAAPEASGITAGHRNRGVLYVVDDGPGTTSLLAIDARTGRMLRRLPIEGFEGTDTESLAAAPCATGATCLYIGDIGDNTATRDSITLTRVREPSLQDKPPAALPSEQVTWRYPDWAWDAEALLAAPDGTLGVVTKDPGRSGNGAARLYLSPSFTSGTLTKGPRIRLPRPRLPFASAVLGNVVTGGEAGRGRVVLRTYDAIYEFVAPRSAAPLRSFPSWPVEEVASPSERQGEAITYAADGCGLFTVSEGSPALSSVPCD